MTKEMMIELFGYAGSFLVLVSFLMTSEVKLRIVNTVGSVIFMTYAIIIKSYPTAVMNFFLVLINLRFLYKVRQISKEYDMVKVEKDDAVLGYLLERYGDDINSFFAGYKSGSDNYIIWCNGAPVGIVLADKEGDTLYTRLDYSCPASRDFSVGAFVLQEFKKQGFKKIVYTGPSEKHLKYLNKLGYVQKDKYFEKVL